MERQGTGLIQQYGNANSRFWSDHATDKVALLGNGIFENTELPWIFRVVVNWQVPHSIRSSRLSREQLAMIRKLLIIDERKQVTYSTILVAVRRSYII